MLKFLEAGFSCLVARIDVGMVFPRSARYAFLMASGVASRATPKMS